MVCCFIHSHNVFLFAPKRPCAFMPQRPNTTPRRNGPPWKSRNVFSILVCKLCYKIFLSHKNTNLCYYIAEFLHTKNVCTHLVSCIIYYLIQKNFRVKVQKFFHLIMQMTICGHFRYIIIMSAAGSTALIQHMRWVVTYINCPISTRTLFTHFKIFTMWRKSWLMKI